MLSGRDVICLLGRKLPKFGCCSGRSDTVVCVLQGEVGEPGQKGSKGDKGEHVRTPSSSRSHPVYTDLRRVFNQ